jgi:hypothetical protein
MTSQTYRPDSPAVAESLRVQLEPDRFLRPLLDGDWWPCSADLGAELRTLVPVLDQVRGPVARLLLSSEGWVTRPHEIIMDGRTVTVCYLADQAASVITVLCADGGTFTMRVTPPGPAPGAPDRTEPGREEDTWEAEGGGLGPPAYQAVR